MRRSVRILLVYGLLIVMMALLFQNFGSDDSPTTGITTGEFLNAVGEDRIESVLILTRSLEARGRYEGSVLPSGQYDFSAKYPEGYEGQLAEMLEERGVPYDTDHEPPGPWSVLVGMLPWLLLIGFMVFIFMQMQRSGNRIMQFGKTRAKMVKKDHPDITFKDVAGLEEAIEELGEIRDFLADAEKFRAMGARIPKGILLFGPPGTGKTLLAKAVAGEAGRPFFSISGSDFVEMFVGVGASRVRDLFEQAKQNSPAIIFIDEIDAVGRHRGAGLGGGHDEREQTLNQLLVELDGFETNTGVIVIAATNRPDILDPALLRPGRFDRQIVIDSPDIKGRQAILEVHARGKPLKPKIDLEVLARRTPGFTGADLANLINEAALLSARHSKDQVGMDELEEAIDRVIAGPERKARVMSDDERRLIAFHESGHALVGWALPMADPVHKVTIVARGRSLGHTLALPTHDKYLVRRSELLDQLAMLLGGRSAEELIYADPTTGSANDIDKATTIARRMVMEYGMSDQLGPMTYGKQGAEVFLGRDYTRQPDYSDRMAADIDDEVRKLIRAAHSEASRILEAHRPALDRMVEALLEKETLDVKGIEEVLHDVPKWHATDTHEMRLHPPPGITVSDPGRERVAAATRSDQTHSS